MPLIARDGKLLRTESGLASSLDCCCGDPPPPDCACPASDCYPAGKRQFSSVKIEIEIDDEFESVWEVDTLICTNTPCRSKVRYRIEQWKISGLSQFNGTYDATYYVTEGGGFVEGDPANNPCGYWWLPQLTKPIYRIGSIYDTFEDSCASDIAFDYYNGTVSQQFNLFGGAMPIPTSAPSGYFHFPRISYPSWFGLFLGHDFPNAAATLTSKHFACANPESEEVVANYSWPMSGSPAAPAPYRSPAKGVGLGSDGTTTTHSGTTGVGTMMPHQSAVGANGCGIGLAEWHFHLPAYSHEATPAVPAPCAFGSTQAQPRRTKAFWPEFNWRVRAILNA